MAYDRYGRGDDSRGRDERSDRSARRGDDRGFFERAGDEISSWFGGSGDDRDRHERDRDRERGIWRSGPEQGRDRDYDRGYGRDYDRDREQSQRHRPSDRDFNEDRGVFSRGGSSDSDYNRGWRRDLWGSGNRGQDDNRSRSERGYRPMTGDYGRGTDHESEQFFAASGYGRGERGFGSYDRDDDRRLREFHRESDREEGPWSEDQYRQTSFAGSRKGERDYDPNYRNWRDRHMSEIDRDYHDYRRENQSRFEDDFSGWRDKRQQKRGLLSQIREHMDVVGKDDEHVGTIDKVAGDRIILTKSDPQSGGGHHSLGCSDIDRVEGNRVILDCSAKDARSRWRDEDRSRALFERHDQGEDGPGVLNRSFSGTYRDR